MKFQVTFKDPDGPYNCITEAAERMAKEATGVDEEEREAIAESRREKLRELCSKWFEYGEYVTLEIDTEKKSIRVVPCK